MSDSKGAAIEKALAQNFQVTRIGRATDPKPKDKVWFTTQMQDLFVLDFEAAQQAILAILAQEVNKAIVAARLAEARHIEIETARQFEKLCRAVESRPELGNSSKSKKHNFLDGAEAMILVPSIRISELERLG